MPNNNAVTLITGGASGIGLALAHEFARHGHTLVLVDMDQQRLYEAAQAVRSAHNVMVHCFVEDLTQENAITHLWQGITDAKMEIDILVNNAGFGVLGPFHTNDIAKYMKMITLHVHVPTLLTRRFLDERIPAKKSGRVLNVVSIGGFMPCPLFSIYHATKAYNLFFCEALADELEPYGIHVSALCPGAARTNFHKTAKNEHVKAAKIKLMEADVIARIGYKEFFANKTIIVPGWNNKFILLMVRLLPRRMVARIMKGYYQE
jgi:short-subunit dehydrogenase